MISHTKINSPGIFVAFLIFLLPMAPGKAQTQSIGSLKFEPRHRVNAHGDEFNALARSLDGRRLFVGTEKGEIIVWNISLQKVERKLRQPGPVHVITTVADPRYIIAAGSNHYEPLRPLVRRWDVDSGDFEDLPGIGSSSFPSTLATDARLIAVGSADGTLLVWDWTSKRLLATWKLKEIPVSLALNRQTLYVVSLDSASLDSENGMTGNAIRTLNVAAPKTPPAELLKAQRGVWTAIAISPDGKLLSATYSSPASKEQVVVIDPLSKTRLGSFSAAASTWLDASNLLLFDWLDPSELVRIGRNRRAISVRKFDRMEADTPGRAFALSGLASNARGSKAWATYRKGPSLLEFDLSAGKIKTLLGGPSGAYGLSVLPQDAVNGLLLTGGADGYVRLWQLSDISLIREYEVAPPGHFVSSVHLVPGGRQAVVGVMKIGKKGPLVEPTEVNLLNLDTGERKKLLDVKWSQGNVALVEDQLLYSDTDRVKLVTLDLQPIREFTAKAPILGTAVSANGQWLAILDSSQTLSVFEIATAKQTVIKSSSGLDSRPSVVTNDGRFVYQIVGGGELSRWDMQSGQESESVLEELSKRHSRSDFMTLANDDQWLITAGNHGDVGIFDRATGALVCYTQFSAAGFYAERVWVSGNRMIVTTDTGVMVEGSLIK